MISVPVNKVLPDFMQLKRKLHIQSEREENLVRLLLDEFKLLVDPRYSFKRVKFNEQPLLDMVSNSKDLKATMVGSLEGFVVIATLRGAVIPDEPALALYADRMLSDMTENLAELSGQELLKKFYTEVNFLTRRYSPGYGDLPLSKQKELFSLFSDTKLDVKLNEHFYMEPEKSVSYIVGVRGAK
jgi:hypothetical protein